MENGLVTEQVNRVKTYTRSIKDELYGVCIFVAVIWGVFLVDYILLRRFNALDLRGWGLVPRTFWGLSGILTMPLLHQNFNHIISNTVSLFVLLSLLAGSRAKSWLIVTLVTILSGALLWLIGPSSRHIGASGLVFGLISFLIAAGVFERRLIPLGISIVVGLLYLPTLVWGILPFTTEKGVSWQGHLCGAIAGVAVAYWLTVERGETTTPELDDLVGGLP